MAYHDLKEAVASTRRPEDVLAARAARRASYRVGMARGFAVGQIWAPRVTRTETVLRSDCWRIEAITDHDVSPIIARSHYGTIRCFGLDGHHDGEEATGDLDLTVLMLEAV